MGAEKFAPLLSEEKMNLYKKIKFGISLVVGLVMNAVYTISTKAADFGTDAKNDIFTGASSGGAFDDLRTKMSNIGKSGYILVLTFSTAVLLCFIVLAGLGFSASKSGHKREEGKGWLKAIAISGILVFGTTTIISLALTFSNGF